MCDMLVFPLGGLLRAATGQQPAAFGGAEKRLIPMPPATRLAVAALLTIALIGMALWMASAKGGFVDYVLAAFFPLNYIMIRLLVPGRG